MINYSWKIIELFNDAKSIKYLATATDNVNTVESEGNYTFSEGVVNKPFSEIVEQDLINWLIAETTKNNVNAIKLALENQLKNIQTKEKVDFPWLAGTFTIE